MVFLSSLFSYSIFATEITTVEGVIDRAVTALKQDQEARSKDHPEIAAQIEQFVGKLVKLKKPGNKFTMVENKFCYLILPFLH